MVDFTIENYELLAELQEYEMCPTCGGTDSSNNTNSGRK